MSSLDYTHSDSAPPPFLQFNATLAQKFSLEQTFWMMNFKKSRTRFLARCPGFSCGPLHHHCHNLFQRYHSLVALRFRQWPRDWIKQHQRIQTTGLKLNVWMSHCFPAEQECDVTGAGKVFCRSRKSCLWQQPLALSEKPWLCASTAVHMTCFVTQGQNLARCSHKIVPLGGGHICWNDSR